MYDRVHSLRGELVELLLLRDIDPMERHFSDAKMSVGSIADIAPGHMVPIGDKLIDQIGADEAGRAEYDNHPVIESTLRSAACISSARFQSSSVSISCTRSRGSTIG